MNNSKTIGILVLALTVALASSALAVPGISLPNLEGQLMLAQAETTPEKPQDTTTKRPRPKPKPKPKPKPPPSPSS